MSNAAQTHPLAEQALRDFVFQQIELWNAGRKADFMALYRDTAPTGLTLEYVAKQTLTGNAAWAGLEQMWETYQARVKLQLFECIVNGTDAACYFRNLWSGEQTLSSGIEVYSLREGALHARLFH
jgi:hypothetical protein